MANTTGKKFGGRKKGSLNKLTTNVKDNVIAVFEGIGGVDNMIEWARENQTDFYKLYAKLLPRDLNITQGDSVIEKILEGLDDDGIVTFINGISSYASSKNSSEDIEAQAFTEQSDKLH